MEERKVIGKRGGVKWGGRGERITHWVPTRLATDELNSLHVQRVDT